MVENIYKFELVLHKGSLNVELIFKNWLNSERENNYGAFITFVGIVREEKNIEGLSFDISQPILLDWFREWDKKAKKRGAKVKMAHSIGDVKIYESSFVSAVFSPKRRVALEFIDSFVEDFKANAPIWKLILSNGKRVYAKERSTLIKGAGLLS